MMFSPSKYYRKRMEEHDAVFKHLNNQNTDKVGVNECQMQQLPSNFQVQNGHKNVQRCKQIAEHMINPKCYTTNTKTKKTNTKTNTNITNTNINITK